MLRNSSRFIFRTQVASHRITSKSRPRCYSTPSSTTTPKGLSGLTTPALVILAIGGGAFIYTSFDDERKLLSSHQQISKDVLELKPDEQVELVKHWKRRYEKRQAIERLHNDELQTELSKIESSHPGALERRKACEERRAKIKEYEIKLMHDRHDESFPNMGGKMQSWAEKKRSHALEETKVDEKMIGLEKKLKGMGFDC